MHFYLCQKRRGDRNGENVAGIKPEHLKKIITEFKLDISEDSTKAQTLLCLAAVFTKYSSSSFFGTEGESPVALRHYAYALMKEVNKLTPSVCGDKFNKWKDALLGLNGAFTCTAVLYHDMIAHAKAKFPSTLATIRPPAWS